MNAEPRSRPPANNPPTKIASSAFGFCAGNTAEAVLIFSSALSRETKSVRGHCNWQPDKKNVNDQLDEDDFGRYRPLGSCRKWRHNQIHHQKHDDPIERSRSPVRPREKRKWQTRLHKHRRNAERNHEMQQQSESSAHPSVAERSLAQKSTGDPLPDAQRSNPFQSKLKARGDAVKNRTRYAAPQDCPECPSHLLIVRAFGTSSRSESDSIEQIRIALLAILASPAPGTSFGLGPRRPRQRARPDRSHRSPIPTTSTRPATPRCLDSLSLSEYHLQFLQFDTPQHG